MFVLFSAAALISAAEPQPLDPPLQALLAAAAAQGDAAFSDAVQLLTLTAPVESVAAGAARISDSRGQQARRLLGLTPPAVPSETAASPAAAPSSARPAEPPKPLWRSLPARTARLIAEAESDLWEGRIQLGARSDSGDSERLDYTLGLAAERELVGWGFEAGLVYSYSETDNRIGRDEFIARARGEREAGERWTLFANTEWERDQLSGFDWTGFFGVGAGYRAIDREAMNWTLRAAPGVRYLSEADNGDRVEGAFDLMSDAELQVTDAMRLEAETRLLAAENARADQVVRLSTALGEVWSLEVSYRYRYEFDPEPGFEAGDSRTDLSLVREF